MIKKTYILGAIQLLTLFLITVYVESVANNELLFTKGVLDEELRTKIIENPIKVLLALGILNFSIYIFSHQNRENKELFNLYNNICQLVFDKFIKPNTTLENSKFRVSLFKAKKGIIFRRSNYFLPEYRTYLKNVGRFQTRQEKKISKIKFLPNEGAVGKSYSIGEFMFFDTVKYSNNNESEYIKQQMNMLNMPKFKIKKLNDKSCSFISCPIKYFKSDDLFGVIVVDCLMPNKLKEEEFRTIEDVVLNYSVFFTNNGN
ncbi:MAG: hypothetical protein LAT51_13530 [Flavobacteriaceae bacterium]|nr:hypothetical protein [Flavobacteriaceae bacterium]